MGAEDAMEEDDDDVDFNPYLQLSPSLDGASGDSSEGEGEVEEAEDDVDLDVQDDSQNREDLHSSEKEREREWGTHLDEEDFFELGSDDYEEEDIEDEEHDDIVQGGGRNSNFGDYSTRSISLHKDGTHIVQSRLNKDEDNGDDACAIASDQDADAVKQATEDDESQFLTRNLGSSKISDDFEHGTETGSPGQSMGTLRELRIFRRGTLSGEVLRGDNSEDIGHDSVDAISKRTRAHYSLTDMSLDQLEMFLNESDEEEYFQNVDDEEEYRKFLLAVQEKQDGGDEQGGLQERKEDEDDEEEDADFEFEIEEALESDYEDASGFTRKRKRRPETRENRRQRARSQNKGLHLNQSKAPLRPLLPHVSDLTYSLGEKRKFTDVDDHVWAHNLKKKVPVNGFTAHQIGQLYCLIHEHVQLLVQVHAMCVLEPSRQQITNDTRRMLMEMADKRDVLLSWKKTAFPDFCFRPPYTHPSFTENDEETPLHRFQFSSDAVASSLATCRRDTFGESEAYPLAQCPGRDLVSWMSVESGSLSSAAPAGQMSTLLSADPGGSVSQLCSFPGSLDSRSFLRDRQTEVSHAWHQPFSISQTPGSGQTNLRVADQTCASDRSSESRVIQVGACFGEDPYGRQTAVKTVPSATTHISNSFSLVMSSTSPQPFNVYGDEGFRQVKNISSEWAPATSGPVRSLLDVAPLALMREFLDDISRVAEDYRQRHVERGAYHSQCEREPLFAVPLADHHEGDARRSSKPRTSALSLNGEALPVAAPRMQIKKTMAAALVESTKKESIALVPKDVAKAVQRFFPFFNPALFPHKPPPLAAANRLLFTDAEDELLAMGLLMYNTDWTAIQQRFLPSKSMHQIFVRQKNRSSARAPENSIKAVRRMKSAPLTGVEKARIQEGLKIYKYDWHKVWEFCVPHRDPAVLPRQWRIALGTQKSYKTSETSKERRRVYEANRRQAKKAIEYGADFKKDAVPSYVETGIESRDLISGEDDGYDEEAYIREAFLADWCPSKSPSVGSPPPPSGGPNTQRPKTKLSASKKRKVQLDQTSLTKPVPSVPLSNLAPGPSAWFNSQALIFGTNIAKQTVKLAPGLPSVKLPPHVHVLSQALVPALPPLSPNATGEFPVASVTSRRCNITGQKWSRTTGQSIARAVPLNPPRHLTSAFLPKNASGRPVFQSSMQKYRYNSKPTPLPAEDVCISPIQSSQQESKLPVANGSASSALTATNVDLRRLAKDLDKKFGISQAVPSLDLNRSQTSVESTSEQDQINSSSHALPSGDIQPVSVQSFGHKYCPTTGAPSGSGPVSFAKSNRVSSRRRNERVPVVSSNSSNTDYLLTSLEVVSTGTQKCDLPQICIPAVTSSPPIIDREWQIPSAPALRSDCKTGSASELLSDDPSKATKAFIGGDVADQLVAGFPVEPSEPTSMQKDQDPHVKETSNKKSNAKRRNRLASRAKQKSDKQGADKAKQGTSKLRADVGHSLSNCVSTATEAGLTAGHRGRKHQDREAAETRVQDPNLEPHVIVMEQEELTDSEDEASIGVEFEHEEMGDSDKDVELELYAFDQRKESTIEFEEEEIESDKEREDSLTDEHIQERSNEGIASTPAEAEILTRDKCTQVLSSAQNDGHNIVSFRIKTPENSETITDVPDHCIDGKTSGKNSLKGKQAGRAVKGKGVGKWKDLELNTGSSHQVHEGKRQELAKNTRAREKKKTEEHELASAIAAAEVLAVIHQVPAVSRK